MQDSFIRLWDRVDDEMASDLSTDPGDDALATAIGQYVLGEISLGKAVEKVGMMRWEFEDLLQDAGFTALYGPRTREQLEDKVEVALDLEEEMGGELASELRSAERPGHGHAPPSRGRLKR